MLVLSTLQYLLIIIVPYCFILQHIKSKIIYLKILLTYILYNNILNAIIIFIFF